MQVSPDLPAATGVLMPTAGFQSFFMGGFECSSHRRRDGRRLDLIAQTGHDARAAEDYRMLASHGMRTVRDGVRWHLVERRPRRFELDSFLPMLRAALATETQVIWDLLHYGWPGTIDIWRPEFIERFVGFVRVIAQTVRDESDEVPYYTPVNEMSFFAWGGGDVEYLNPFARGRGGELKRILVRATIAAINAIREIDSRARFVAAEPLIHIFPKSQSDEDIRIAERHTASQFEATDLLSGRLEPELGGAPRYLDIFGVNFYYKNQWIDRGHTVFLGDGQYRPLSELLIEASNRYERPFFIAETGTEAGGRAPWLHYVCDEVRDAHAAGTCVEGLCLYPILNHRGWDDERHCHNGMFCGIEPDGSRLIHSRLGAELARQRSMFEE
jgi:hypothetical protein